MRLLKLNNDGSFRLESFLEDEEPAYAILSHTWGTGKDDEVTFKDLKDGIAEDKPGFRKLEFCGNQAKHDGLQYFWVDTCCINKSNEKELTTAINSMFRWYQNAARCYVYLSDVSVRTRDGQAAHVEWESAFRNSRWFTRGWTLQELLAPKIVDFYSRDGIRLGDKSSCEQRVIEITGIPIEALRGQMLSKFSVEERFSWTEKRHTSMSEDKAYCLLGIFNVFLPLIYGEGQENAMRRLRRESASTELQPTAIDPPSYVIPFPRNNRFIGRSTVLDDLEQRLLVGQKSQVALVGLGGIGKTQIALEFAFKVKVSRPDYSIFWIPALSVESMEQACGDIARIRKIPQAADDKEDVKELVKDYLSSDAAGKWLLIVDNADDINLLFGGEQQIQGIADYLPRSENGLILLTTRFQEVAASLATDIIEVEEMNIQEAASFLGKSLVSNSFARKQLLDNEAVVTELLNELACLPLAIAQAAAYLSKNKNVLIADYLKLLRKTEQDFISLLNQEFRDSTRYRDKNTANAVARTWLVSFNQIREHDPVAADLLSFISCIESKAIPYSILPPVQPEERMVRAVGTLCGYSFMIRRGNSDMYDTHRLVHLAMGKWVEESDSLAKTVEMAIQHLSAIFPFAKYENQAMCREYLIHALRLLKGKQGQAIEERYKLCLRVGMFLSYEGRISESVEWVKESCRWREENLAEDHPDRLASQHELAIVYQRDGQISKAVELLEHVVAVKGQILAEEHPSRLASQHALAMAYQGDGQISKAVELLEHVVAVEGRILAEEHPDRLASQHVLAMAYQEDGQISKAVELMEHVVTVQGRTLAEEHPDRLASQHVLAMAYQSDGRISKAVELMEHVVTVKGRTLAEEHPARLVSQHALAIAYQGDGQISKAVELIEHVVTVKGRTLAEEHPDRLASQHVLAMVYQEDGQISKAVELLEHVVAVRGRILAEEHPDRLASQHMLAMAYRKDGQISKAVKLIEHVVAVKGQILAEEHPSRLASQHALAIAYQGDGQISKAVELLEHVVAVEGRILAEEHPDRLASQHVLAMAYQEDGQISKAVELMEHVVIVKGRILAEEHPDRLASQHVLAIAYQEDGQISKAVELLEHVVAVEGRILVEEHPSRLVSEHALEYIHTQLSDNP